MGELLLIVLAAALVNNFVLVQFLGLCPAMGASRRLEGAMGMALATGLVLTTASGLSYLVDRFHPARGEPGVVQRQPDAHAGQLVQGTGDLPAAQDRRLRHLQHQ